MNISDAKSKLVDAMGSMDLTKMSLNDLALYMQVLRSAAEIPTPDPLSSTASALMGFCLGCCHGCSGEDAGDRTDAAPADM